MTNDSVDLPSSLTGPLKQMHQAKLLATKLDAAAAAELAEDHVSVVKKIEDRMQQPTWNMLTQTKVTGGVGKQIFAFKLNMNFLLDITTLVEMVDHHNLIEEQEVQAYVKHSEMTSTELGDIVMEALRPRSFGVSDSITIEEWQVPEDMEHNKDQFIQSKWVVELFAEDETVYFNYAPALTYLLGYSRIVNPDLFADRCKAGLAFFRDRDSKTYDFNWKDTDMSLTVDVDFVRL